MEIYLTLKISKKADILECEEMERLFREWKKKSKNHLDFIGSEDQAYSYSFLVEKDEFSV